LAWITAGNGLSQEPDVAPAAKLGDREHPWTSLGTRGKQALI